MNYMKLRTSFVAAMALLCLGVPVLALAQTPYTNPKLGLTFQLPATWANLGKKKDVTQFKITLEGTTQTAMLTLVETAFRSDADVFQTVQLRASEQLKRTVEKQWQQEVLGVPMLYTLTAYSDKGQEVKTLTGLLYSSSQTKMLIRLTAPIGYFEVAEAQWNTVLESLRTNDGTLPESENPDKPAQVKKPTEKVPPVLRMDEETEAKQNSQKISALKLSEKVTLAHDPAINLSIEEGGILKIEGISMSASFTVGDTASQRTPQSFLAVEIANRLAKFEGFPKRRDAFFAKNEFGAEASWTSRFGKVAGQDKQEFLGYITNGTEFFIVTISREKEFSEGEMKTLSRVFKRSKLQVAQ